MNKKRIESLTITSLLLISTLLIIAYTPNSAAATVKHTATVSPATTTSPSQKYVFNVTNLSTENEKITNVTITFPSGFTVTGVQSPSGWTNNTGWPTIAFRNTTDLGINPNGWKLFNITVNWPAVPPKTVTLYVNCSSLGTQSTNNPVALTITFNPQFTSTITPTLVKGSTSYKFNITIINTASTAGLGTVNVTYPSGWTFNAIVNYGGSRSWSIVHDPSARTFKLSGPNLLIGEYFWILVNMTTQSGTADPVNWLARAWDISGTFLGIYNLPVTVDAAKPTVTINQPGLNVYYTVGSGKRIWINGTVSDDLNITKYGLAVVINDTRFERLVWTKTSDTQYSYAFANKTAIPDGKLAVKITATDASGHVGYAERQTTIDNTAPQIVWVKVLDQSNNELPYVSNIYWMGAGTTSIKVNASFYNPAAPLVGKIYLNSTQYNFVNKTETSPAFSVSGSDYVILKITLIDNAEPNPNNFTRTWEIKRDRVKPSAPTFTVQPICGGAIVRGLTATDNVGVLSYKVYTNGSLAATVSIASLQASTLTSIGSHRAFSGILVLSLASYAGRTANITITAVDYGANEGPGLSRVISVPEGTWYPVVLYPKWNLVSLPLIPNSTATADIYSLILKQGAAGVTVTYGFDNTAKTWIMDPATMTDGKGYWIYMKAYDVLIVQGRPTPTPPALPTTYHLIKGWDLVGYKETVSMNASAYIESLEPGSYYRWLYVWDAATQSWRMVDTNPATSGTLSPGQAFWIYLYKDQDLVPPIP